MIWSIMATGSLPMTDFIRRNNFPEFTSRVCPALCEKACTCNLNGDPVATQVLMNIAIIEHAYAEGYAASEAAERRVPARKWLS